MRAAYAFAIAVLAGAFTALPAWSPAWAQDGLLSGTLKTVKDRGTLLLGVREAAIPFAFTNRGGEAVGFSVDLCTGIAEDVAKLLNMELLAAGAPAWQRGLRIRYVPVAPEARLRLIVSGEIDLECGSTTANDERAKTVAFSPVFFLAGTKLLVAADSGITSYLDLAGKTVVVSTGTTNAGVMRTLANRAAPRFAVFEAPDLPAAYGMLAANRAAAFASDDILLAGMQATRPDGSRFRVVGDYLSYEPYALMLRKDDNLFAGLIANSFQRMAQEGSLRASYNRWFMSKLPNGENLHLPISAHLAEMYRALGEPD